MGTSWSSPELPAGAQFASGEQSAVASFPPCHVFGDPGLYGVGIRAGYYLQYAAALLSVLFLHSQDQRLWFISFLPLAAANLVGLSLNAAEGGLVILDWSIVFGLVFWSIAFLVWPVLHRHSRAVGSGRVGDPKQLRQDLEKEGGRTVTDQEAEWHARYVAVLEVLMGRHGQPNHNGHHETGDGGKQYRLEAALRDYVMAFASARFSPASVSACSYILDLYADAQLRDIAMGMMTDNAQIESFRDGHAEALRRANVPFDQAQSTTQTLGRLAVDGPRAGEASYRASPQWLALSRLGIYGGGHGTGTIGCGLGLMLYSGFSAFMVWLLFRGMGHGSQSGCNVRFIFFVVPVSVYNAGAITALRVLSSIWLALAAVPALLAGLVLLVVGTKAWWVAGTSASTASAAHMGLGAPPAPHDAEKGKETELMSPAITRASRTSELLYEMDELPPHSSSPTSPRDTRISSYHSGSILKDMEPMMGAATGSAVDMRGGLAGDRIHLVPSVGSLRGPDGRWKRVLLLLPVAHTMVVVELTIRINGVDMRQRPMTSMVELLAFFLGMFVFVSVLARCLRAAKGRPQRQRQAGWADERRGILLAPATRLGGEQAVYPGGGGLRREVSAGGESGFSKEVEMTKASKQRKIYLQPERKSGSSMGKFREMIDEDDEK